MEGWKKFLGKNILRWLQGMEISNENRLITRIYSSTNSSGPQNYLINYTYFSKEALNYL